jgi:RNA polymerase sigma-70 factor (ECF subfamily)
LACLRRDLLRFACLYLNHDDDSAEDAVQEALLAASRAPERFAGRAAVRTWVFGILKHKLIDEIRRQRRRVYLTPLPSEDEADDFDALFDARGHWNADDQPPAWSDPDASLEQRQFWQVFETCLTRLPESTARVFMMREFLDLDTPEISGHFDITPNHCWVILHRARAGLRLCLQTRWFGEEARA